MRMRPPPRSCTWLDVHHWRLCFGTCLSVWSFYLSVLCSFSILSWFHLLWPQSFPRLPPLPPRLFSASAPVTMLKGNMKVGSGAGSPPSHRRHPLVTTATRFFFVTSRGAALLGPLLQAPISWSSLICLIGRGLIGLICIWAGQNDFPIIISPRF